MNTETDRHPIPDALGVDAGGALITLTDRDEDSPIFHAKYLERPEIRGAIDALARLSRERFGDPLLPHPAGQGPDRARCGRIGR